LINISTSITTKLITTMTTHHHRDQMTLAIHTRNRPSLVKKLLGSLVTQRVLPDYLMVVENVSEGKYFSQKIISSMVPNKVTCIYKSIICDNVAFSRNISLYHAPGDILVSIDDDAIFSNPYTLERIKKLHKKYPQVSGFVGPVFSDSASAWAQFSAAIYGGVPKDTPGITNIATYPSTFYSLRRRQIVDKKMRFNTHLGDNPKVGEDIDFFWRLTTSGLTVAYHPSLQVKAAFPDSFVSFFKKHVHYAKNYASLWRVSGKENDGITWLMPKRRLHILLYPVFFTLQCMERVKKEIKETQLSNLFVPISITKHLASAIGILISSEGKAAFLKNLSAVWGASPTISLLLTSDVTSIDPNSPAGTEGVFIQDIRMLLGKGFTLQAFARSDLPWLHIHKLWFPISTQENHAEWKSFFYQFLYVLQWIIRQYSSRMAIIYAMPLAGIFAPEKSIVFFHYEQALPLWSVFKNRYKKMQFLFCSDFLKNSFLAAYPDIDKRACRTLHNAIDPSIFHFQKPRAPSKKITLLYANAWVHEKGLLVLLRAIQSLPLTIRRRFELIIASGPTLWKSEPTAQRIRYVRDVNRHLAHLTNVTVLSGVSQHALTALYSKSDWLMFPSVWDEPFGLCALEAIACGCPVVGPNRGGLPEILSRNNSFHLSETSEETIAKAISDIVAGTRKGKRKSHSLLTRKNASMIYDVRAKEMVQLIHTFLRPPGHRSQRVS
jgi:glycosyltransferase involved in cell wall biosynthesis